MKKIRNISGLFLVLPHFFPLPKKDLWYSVCERTSITQHVRSLHYIYCGVYISRHLAYINNNKFSSHSINKCVCVFPRGFSFRKKNYDNSKGLIRFPSRVTCESGIHYTLDPWRNIRTGNIAIIYQNDDYKFLKTLTRLTAYELIQSVVLSMAWVYLLSFFPQVYEYERVFI